MQNKLNYSKQALRDLDNIFDYIATDLDNEQAASRLIDKIMDAAEQLCTFPKMGAALSSIVDIPNEYRFLVCENYLTFYRVLENQIQIDRVLYGRSDYLRTLLEKTNQEPLQ